MQAGSVVHTGAGAAAGASIKLKLFSALTSNSEIFCVISNGQRSHQSCSAATKAASVAPRAWARGRGADPAAPGPRPPPASPLVCGCGCGCGCACRARSGRCHAHPRAVQRTAAWTGRVTGCARGGWEDRARVEWKAGACAARSARWTTTAGRHRWWREPRCKCNHRPTKATSMDGLLYKVPSLAAVAVAANVDTDVTITGASECGPTGTVKRQRWTRSFMLANGLSCLGSGDSMHPSPTQPCGRRRRRSAGLFDPHILYLERKS